MADGLRKATTAVSVLNVVQVIQFQICNQFPRVTVSSKGTIHSVILSLARYFPCRLFCVYIIYRLNMTKKSFINSPDMELLLFPETVATSGKGLLMFFVQPSWKSISQPASLVGG